MICKIDTKNGGMMTHSRLVLMPVLKRYLQLRADIQLGIETGKVDLILGQNWLDINDARMKGAK